MDPLSAAALKSPDQPQAHAKSHHYLQQEARRTRQFAHRLWQIHALSIPSSYFKKQDHSSYCSSESSAVGRHSGSF